MFPNYLHTNPHLSKEFHIAKKQEKQKCLGALNRK